jgi:hypothetical protein
MKPGVGFVVAVEVFMMSRVRFGVSRAVSAIRGLTAWTRGLLCDSHQINDGDLHPSPFEDVFDNRPAPDAVFREQLPSRTAFPLNVDGRRIETNPCRGLYAISKNMFVNVRRRVALCGFHGIESVLGDNGGEAEFSDSKLLGSSSVLHWDL